MGAVLWGCARPPSPSTPAADGTPVASEPAVTVPVPAITVPVPTPSAGETPDSLFPPVTDADWSLGPKDAKVTFVAYCDFQSRGCAGLALALDRLMADHPGEVRKVFREYPMIAEHDKAVAAAEAAESAGAQGKFWEMHDRLYADQDEWLGMSAGEFRNHLAQAASELGLDSDQFGADLDRHVYLDKLDREYRLAFEAGIPGAPFLLMNGVPYQGPGEIWALESLVRLELLKSRQYPAYPPIVVERGLRYTATLHTTKGEVTIELYPERAPMAVNNFVFLAREGWYDHTSFHHVLPGFMARAGDPTGTGMGGPGYSFENEISPSLRFDQPGMVAVFNLGPGTNGSQFFITYSEQPNLTGNYSIFGKVVAGMDAVNALAARNPELDPSAPPGDEILSIEILEQ